MKLKDVEIQRSKVYVTDGRHTMSFNIGTLDIYGDYEVVELHVICGNVYIEVRRNK